MKNVKIKGGQFLKGDITIPPSKSLSHRAIIAASLAEGTSKIHNLIQSKDIIATTNCMKNLGAEFEVNSTYKVTGIGKEMVLSNHRFDCHESGSTLRFLIPIAMLSNQRVTFEGKGKLVTRPLDPFFKLFEEQNISYQYKNGLPLDITGSFKPGIFKISGDVSSQFITGLLFTLPLLEEASEIHITTNLESKGYIDLTLDVLKQFGIKIINEDYKKFIIPGKQSYLARDYRVEGDFSQIAFWLVAGLINGDINCFDMNIHSSQGDKEILEIVQRMNSDITIKEESISVKKSNTTNTIIDGSQCPDIIPVLTVLAAVSEGETQIVNAGRLRIKECDRLTAIAEELNKLGADVTELQDGLIVRGKKNLNGGHVKGWNDHRIVMALAVASLVCTEEVFIEGADAITKSYPHFFEQFRELGGIVSEWNLEK